MKRFFAFLTALVLSLSLMATSACALTKNAVVSVFLGSQGSQRNQWT